MKVIRPFANLPAINHEELNNHTQAYSILTKFFKPDEIARIKAMWDDAMAKEAEVNYSKDDAADTDLRRSKVIFLEEETAGWVYDKLASACIVLNAGKFKFDIRGFQSKLQLATYGEGGFFEWHKDFGAGNNSTRKLSITVQLSEPHEYEGGELQFMRNHHIDTVPKELGTAVIFPSYEQHRVTPVTRGKRISIVGWIAGPPYK